MVTGADLARQALRIAGNPYVFGAEVNGIPWDTVVARRLALDCSEMVENVCLSLGVPMVDGAANQKNFCAQRGLLITEMRARQTVGALAFVGRTPHHVYMSLGNGSTIEAANRRDGCGVFNFSGRGATYWALIPGVDYGQPAPTPPPAPAPAPLPPGSSTVRNRMLLLIKAPDNPAIWLTDGLIKRLMHAVGPGSDTEFWSTVIKFSGGGGEVHVRPAAEVDAIVTVPTA